MHPEPHVARYVPANNNEGWGIAAIIVGIAIAVNVLATWYHFSSYRDARDPTWGGYDGPHSAAAQPGAAETH